MLVSTRGRYALRFLIDIAENQGENKYISMSQIAHRQEVSVKYAERLMAVLVRNKFVEVLHGKSGGYRLARNPEDYKVGEVLLAMNEELVPVECMKCEPNKCHRAENCRTLPMWQKLGKVINEFVDGVTLADLVKK